MLGGLIGILMFVVLVLGATYAWLNFSANIINGVVNGKTLNYWVNYAKGTDISNIPILVEPTTSTASHVTLTAQRPDGSLADNITIYLTTTSTNALTTDGVVRYVICEGACDESFSGNTINTVTSSGTVSIYSGTLPGTLHYTKDENNVIIENDTITYNVYFWLDAETITNDHLNKSYSGYLHAASTQNPTSSSQADE